MLYITYEVKLICQAFCSIESFSIFPDIYAHTDWYVNIQIDSMYSWKLNSLECVYKLAIYAYRFEHFSKWYRTLESLILRIFEIFYAYNIHTHMACRKINEKSRLFIISCTLTTNVTYYSVCVCVRILQFSIPISIQSDPIQFGLNWAELSWSAVHSKRPKCIYNKISFVLIVNTYIYIYMSSPLIHSSVSAEVANERLNDIESLFIVFDCTLLVSQQSLHNILLI